MESRFSRQLKKGVLEMVVLGLICKEPTYGYELLTQMDKQSNGLLLLKEGTLYPILYRLEDDGLITAQWQTSEGRTAPRKVYTATDKGFIVLQEQHNTWKQFTTCIDQFCEEEQS